MKVAAGRPPTWAERFYFFEILKGMTLTLVHLIRGLLGYRVTMQYPEEKWQPGPNYRGLHILTMDQDGVENCVACGMCALACPADCITIIPGEMPEDTDRERFPVRFEIDELRCIFCGFCVEACPKDAIRMTTQYESADFTRQALIFDKARLMAAGRAESLKEARGSA